MYWYDRAVKSIDVNLIEPLNFAYGSVHTINGISFSGTLEGVFGKTEVGQCALNQYITKFAFSLFVSLSLLYLVYFANSLTLIVYILLCDSVFPLFYHLLLSHTLIV